MGLNSDLILVKIITQKIEIKDPEKLEKINVKWELTLILTSTNF